MDVEDSKETAAPTADTSSSVTIQLVSFVSYGIKYIKIRSSLRRPFNCYDRER
jgi:hypothetical protein